MKNKIKKNRGFTLIEILISVIALGVFIGIMITAISTLHKHRERLVDVQVDEGLVSAQHQLAVAGYSDDILQQVDPDYQSKGTYVGGAVTTQSKEKVKVKSLQLIDAE